MKEIFWLQRLPSHLVRPALPTLSIPHSLQVASKFPGKLMAANVKPGKVKTVRGGSVIIKVNGGKVMIDKAHVAKTNIAADNGVPPVIDTVLMPRMSCQTTPASVLAFCSINSGAAR